MSVDETEDGNRRAFQRFLSFIHYIARKDAGDGVLLLSPNGKCQ